jgi:hypothetical protein
MVRLLITDDKEAAIRDFGDLELFLRREFRENSAVIYDYCIPNCADVLKDRNADCLVTNLGHGSRTAVENIERTLGEPISVPYFDSSKYRGNDIKRDVRAWLKRIYQR